MRILCLHDHGSSAAAFYKALKKLENRLYNSHGIELVFVDSPFCLKEQRNDKVEHPVILKEQNCIDAHKDTQPSRNERAWFHKSSGDSFSSVLGLDASILHLRQIWSQSLLSRPFDGVIGFGQGADLASIMPLLHSYLTHNDEESFTNDNPKMMFEGLKFCVLIQGCDFLLSRVNEIDEEFEELRLIDSLHIFRKGNSNAQALSRLFQGSGRNNRANVYEETSLLTNKLLNIIGKYLVLLKKNVSLRYMTSCDLMVETGSDRTLVVDSYSSSEREIEATINRTRLKLSILEKKSLDLINSSLTHNPPKALTAVIARTGNNGECIVGGWVIGNKDAIRSKEFKEAGGSPCPSQFILSEKRRGKVATKDMK